MLKWHERIESNMSLNQTDMRQTFQGKDRFGQYDFQLSLYFDYHVHCERNRLTPILTPHFISTM